MEQIIINGGNHRYLSELNEFKDGIPFGIVNKTKTDVGGTYVAANCSSNYIIVCPFIDLVESIANDTNNKYEVFKCYGGIRQSSFTKYLKDHTTYKVAVTYDSLAKLLRWMNNDTKGWKVLVDEYHLILEDMDFRTDAINNLMESIKSFDYYSFLSATPMDINYEIDFFKDLPHYKVEWEGLTKIMPLRIKANKLVKGLTRFIDIFLTEGVKIPNVDGELTNVDELFIFINSVTSIKQILDTLKIDDDLVKVCCANRNRNRLLLDNYVIEPVSNPNKKLNFFTKKCFQGCNLFTNNGLIIVASDGYREQTLVDVSTTMEQIAGRLRFNDTYQNVFRDKMIHMFSTNNNAITDEEFEDIMNTKETEANMLINMTKDYNAEEMQLFAERTNLESDIVSIINGKLVYNKLKKQSFIYKQQLRNSYRDGISVRNDFKKSEKFVTTNQEVWTDFNVKMAKAITISYEQLLKDYLDNPNDSYELEYPEFKEFRKYLKETEMNSLRWNKENMLKAVEDKKNLSKAFKEVHSEGFVSNAVLKDRFKLVFNRLGITLIPKASLIEQCDCYSVTKTSKRINGKKVKGYELGKINLVYKLK